MSFLDLSKLIKEENTLDYFVLREMLKEVAEKIEDNILYNFDGKFFEFSLSGTGSDENLKHNLSFTPKDVIIVSVNPAVSGGSNVEVVFRPESSDSEYAVFRASASCTVRVFIGRYSG